MPPQMPATINSTNRPEMEIVIRGHVQEARPSHNTSRRSLARLVLPLRAGAQMTQVGQIASGESCGWPRQRVPAVIHHLAGRGLLKKINQHPIRKQR
jgi:hypothetical protein